MDDQRIQELTAEVLSQIRGPAHDLETRVAALETAVARLEGTQSVRLAPEPPALQVHSHPSLHVLNVPSGSDRCLMEPDKPCVQSQACRILGH